MQPELTLYTSNRLGVLVDRLAHTLAAEPLSPLEREIVIVQSQGMQRRLTLDLARHHGVAGGLTTPFPRPFCRWLARRVLDRETLPSTEDVGRQEGGPFERDVLAWRLFRILGRTASEDTAGRVSEALAYLESDPDQRKRLQLARRLAGLFDDYQMFRPDLLERWRAGDEVDESSPHHRAERWQAALWRRLLEESPTDESGTEAPLHRRLQALMDALISDADLPGLPSRVSVLGVSSLPPAFIDLLAALSRRLPVAVYFVSPTYHYWGDLRSERETARLARRLRLRPDRLLDEQHFQEGHPLLAALGRQGRDFFNLLQRVDDTGGAWQELEFEDPGQDSALHVLQHDILHLVDRGPDERAVLDPEDRSLEVHACHSPLREMEVLKDRLLDAFRRDPELRPGDVLVQVPDIELYGPYIQAVFGVEPGESPRLPFSIADRRAGREQPPSEVFLEVLDLVGGRLTVRQVFDLLDTPAIRRRFDLAVDEIPTLRRLVDAVEIRWGMDGRQKRRDFDLPAWDANTWRAGLDRLLMGYATGADDPEALPAGIAPHAGDTAGTADAVGRFAAYVERLFGVLRALGVPRPLDRWAELTLDALEALFLGETEAEERGLQWIRDEIRKLTDLGARLELDEAVAPRVVRDHLASVLHGAGFGSGFIDGRITFCALKPMRTIPFRVVCIAGLDDGAFPRRDRQRSFDLIAADPRPGDRSLRDDDRYLFLETLLAAEHRLILTHVGRSQKDSARREPSVVLSELLDQVDRTFGLAHAPERPAREALWVDHRLQAWSPAYFLPPERREPGEERLWSYSQENAHAARALRGDRHGTPRFADGELPGIEDALLESHGAFELETRLDELQDFWRLPCRFWCRRTLGLELPTEEEAKPESEPFLVAGLDAYDLRQWLLERRLERRATVTSETEEAANTEETERPTDAKAREAETREMEAREAEILRARGKLPALDVGLHQLRRQSRRVDAFLDRLPPFRPAPARSVDLRLDPADDDLGFRLTGTSLRGALDDRGRLERILLFRCGTLRPRDRLSAWIELLAVSVDARRRDQEAPSALLVGEDATVELSPPRDAEHHLEELLRGFRRGLGRPLAFFVDAAYAFAEQTARLRDPRNSAYLTPLDKAREIFEGRSTPVGPSPDPEAEDPYARLAFRGVDPLEEPDFARFAERVWQPILDHSREEAP